jgi:lactoylglutathione lyase
VIEACVAFYRDLFGLRQLFEKDENGFKLTCLEYGEGYLMVEQSGKAKNGVKSPKEGSFKLRFNVKDL